MSYNTLSTQKPGSDLDLQKILDLSMTSVGQTSMAILELTRNGQLQDETVVNKYQDRKTGDQRVLTRLKTNADRISHEQIQNALSEYFPEYIVVSEEGRASLKAAAGKIGPGQPYFILDPIDGTAHLQKGTGQWTINLALAVDGIVLIGIVAIPAENKIYFRLATEPSKEKNIESGYIVPITREQREPHDLVVSMCDMLDIGGKTDVVAQEIAQLNNLTKLLIRGSAYRYIELAKRAVDVIFHNSGNLHWDKAAAQAIIEGTGGKLTYIPWPDLTVSEQVKFSELNLQDAKPAHYPIEWIKDQGHVVVSSEFLEQIPVLKYNPSSRHVWDVFFD